MVAAPLLDSSSGCACTHINLNATAPLFLMAPTVLADRRPAWLKPRARCYVRNFVNPVTTWSSPVSTADESAVTWLTQDAFDRLSRELEELIAHRPAMAK